MLTGDLLHSKPIPTDSGGWLTELEAPDQSPDGSSWDYQVLRREQEGRMFVSLFLMHSSV